MKIVKYKKISSNKYELALSNGDKIKLYENVILNNDLLLKKEIDPSDIKIIKENEVEEAYYKTIKYITIRMRSKKEIKEYLKDYDNDIKNKVVDKIIFEGYINDEKYTDAYIKDRINLSMDGYFKIKRDLENNEIDSSLIEKYLDKIDLNIWKEKIRKIVVKKVNLNNKYNTKQLKEKLNIYLVNLGYQYNLIEEILNDIECNDDELIQKDFEKMYIFFKKKYEDKDLEIRIINKLMAKGYNYNKIKELIANKKTQL